MPSLVWGPLLAALLFVGGVTPQSKFVGPGTNRTVSPKELNHLRRNMSNDQLKRFLEPIVEQAHRNYNCTKVPFRHCCPGRCRHFGLFHPDTPTFMRVARALRPTSTLPGLLEYLHSSEACLLGFAGDSMVSDTFAALLCELLQHNYTVTLCRGKWAWAKYMFGENQRFCNSHMQLGGAAVRLKAGAPGPCPEFELFYLENLNPRDRHLLVRYQERRGFLVTNVGMHCNGNDVRCLQGGVNVAVATAWGLHRMGSPLAILWKETEAQHFTAAENGLWEEAARDGACGPIKNLSGANWRNDYVAQALGSMCSPYPIPIVAVHAASLEYWRWHPGGGDCTHYCYAPWIHYPVWANIERAARTLEGPKAPVGDCNRSDTDRSNKKKKKKKRRHGAPANETDSGEIKAEVAAGEAAQELDDTAPEPVRSMETNTAGGTPA